jgi:cation:H+ antiporter
LYSSSLRFFGGALAPCARALFARIPKALAKPFPGLFAFSSGASSALWTFPSVLGSSIIIAWAAEAAQFLVSQGLALAILAWLQTLPEFAVEAVIAWQAGQTVKLGADPYSVAHATALVSANFTGSLRLLVGLGWPMIYVTAAFFHRRQGSRLRRIRLDREHAVEVVFLLISIAYFFLIWAKGTLNLIDSGWLALIYLVYLYFLNKIPPQSEEKIEDMDRVPQIILAQRPSARNSAIVGLFLVGGVALYFTAGPFLESLKGLAAALGLSTFVFVQWVAPFLSEFPEKVSAFNWARKVSTAPMALMNMVSSNINQWTVLVAMLPIAYAWSLGRVATIVFDQHQELEILLTLAQSLLGALLLANMRFHWWEAILLFSLWIIQFVMSGFEKSMDPMMVHNGLAIWVSGWLPVRADQVENFAHRLKEGVTILYFLWSAITLIVFMIKRRGLEAIAIFPKLVREHW